MEKGMNNPLVVASAANKAKNSAVGFYQRNKTTVWTVGGIITAYTIYKIFFDHDNVNFTPRGNEALSTMTEIEAKAIADDLFGAMDRFGTSENVIYNRLNGLSYNDFAKVSRAFGTKWYDTTLGVKGTWALKWAGHKKLGLFEWLNEDLTYSDKLKLQEIMPNVITFDAPVRIGATARLIEDTDLHEPIYVGNDYVTRGQKVGFGKKGDDIGKIERIIHRSGKDFALIDRSWSFKEYFIETNKIKSV